LVTVNNQNSHLSIQGEREENIDKAPATIRKLYTLVDIVPHIYALNTQSQQTH